MKLYIPVDLSKAKFLRKWRGSKGQWRYAYDEAKGRQPAKEKPVSAHRGTLKGVTTEKEIRELRKHFARRPKGMGKEKTIQTRKDLDIILKHTTFALMSASPNPNDPKAMKMSPEEIKAKHGELLERLKADGFVYSQCRGKYGKPEESVMVMMHDSNRDEAIKLGSDFMQDAIVFVNKGKGEMIYTNEKQLGEVSMAGSGHEEVPDASDYYTKMPLSTGETVKFVMSLEDIKKAMREGFMKLVKSRYALMIKAKGMPIGTVSKGRKKVADGKWVDVPNGGSRTRTAKPKEPDTRTVGEKMRDAVPKGPKASADEKKRMSRAIQSAVDKSYYKDIPIDAIDSALKKNGFLLVQEDGTPWEGMLIGADSNTILEIGRVGDFVEKDGVKMHTILKNAGVALSWYKDLKRSDSKYDIVAYLS